MPASHSLSISPARLTVHLSLCPASCSYGSGSFSFSNLIRGVTRRFSTEFELQQLEQFRDNNKDVGFGSATRALEQALEKTKANIKWVKENKEVVLEWFTENSK